MARFSLSPGRRRVLGAAALAAVAAGVTACAYNPGPGGPGANALVTPPSGYADTTCGAQGSMTTP